MGIQSNEPRENWKTLHRDQLATQMHEGGAGIEHPSRTFVASLIRKGESVLDVGCGAGAGYEALASLGLESHYMGIDSSEKSLKLLVPYIRLAIFVSEVLRHSSLSLDAIASMLCSFGMYSSISRISNLPWTKLFPYLAGLRFLSTS